MSDAAANAEAIELTMEREFTHPPEAVFRAWTEQEALRKWMGPGEITAPNSEIDAREGGLLKIPMTHPNGTIFTACGEILELTPNSKLRFTWAWLQEDGSPGQVMDITLDFHATDNGTRLVLHQTNFIDEEARSHHTDGWNGCFEKLAIYLDA